MQGLSCVFVFASKNSKNLLYSRRIAKLYLGVGGFEVPHMYLGRVLDQEGQEAMNKGIAS